MPKRKKNEDDEQQVAAETEVQAEAAEALDGEPGPESEEALPPEETAPESGEETITIPVSEYEALQTECSELRQRVVRMQADFDNTRKRLRREADQAGTRALARFVGPLLTEMDNFEHALKAANPERFQDFAMGVTMIHQNVLSVLNGSGIEMIPCEGVFDPALHEVVQEIEDADRPRGTIVEVLRQGYRLGDQVVRAAQVLVSRPPAEPAAADQAETDADEDAQQD